MAKDTTLRTVLCSFNLWESPLHIFLRGRLTEDASGGCAMAMQCQTRDKLTCHDFAARQGIDP